jgi:hypothetical protein
MRETPYDRYLQLAIPTSGKKLLSIEDINALPDGEVLIGLYPMDPKESLYKIVRRQHHDRISTYAVPHHIYKEQPAKWHYEVTGAGKYELGSTSSHIRLWRLTAPVEPAEEHGDEVWATMLI